MVFVSRFNTIFNFSHLIYYKPYFSRLQYIYQISYLLLGKLNMVPSRTPAEGQRWVMVLRLV